jgi:hypothetical protein
VVLAVSLDLTLEGLSLRFRGLGELEGDSSRWLCGLANKPADVLPPATWTTDSPRRTRLVRDTVRGISKVHESDET